MDPRWLRPHHSRANSENDDYASNRQSSDDGYDYNNVDDAPEAEPTKAKETRSVKTSPAPIEANASKGQEDADPAFTETMPHIWQRQAGGRRAKIPELDLDLEKGLNDKAAAGENKSPEGALTVTSIKLRWTMPEIEGRRVLRLESGKPDVNVQGYYLQRRRVRWQ